MNNTPSQSEIITTTASSLRDALKQRNTEDYPVRSCDLEEIAEILSGPDCDERQAVISLASNLPPGSRLEGFSPLELRSHQAVLGLFRLMAWRSNGDDLRQELQAALPAVDELSLYLLEETGKTYAGELKPLIRDVLSQRKLSMSWEVCGETFHAAILDAMDDARTGFLPNQPEDFRSALVSRMDDTEKAILEQAGLYLGLLEEDLYESPTLDLYLLVMRFLDRAWRQLPVDEPRELRADEDEETVETYLSLLEAFYTRLAGRLAGELIRTLTRATGEV